MSNRLLTALVAIFALALSAPGLVFAQTQTTNSYDAGSTDADIRKSCKELSVSSGTLSGKCNKSGATPQDTTWSLTGGKISCHNNTNEPFWTDNHDSSSDTNYSTLTSSQAKGIDTGSSGNAYYLKADCGSGEMQLPLSRRVKNSSGAFAYSSTNLWN